MPSDLLPPAKDVASLRGTQYQRDRLGLLDLAADGALWRPAVGPAQDFWRTLCERNLDPQEAGAHEEVLKRLNALAHALQTSVTGGGKGQPPLLRSTFNNLVRLPSFKQANDALTAEQWAMLAYAQALRALLELASLNTQSRKKPSLGAEFTLRDAFERATQGFEVQVAAGFLPAASDVAAGDDDWAQAQRQAKQWLQHPDFFNLSGWYLPQYVMRSLVEFIVAYSGLFKDTECTEQNDSDEGEDKNSDGDEETPEDGGEHAGRNKENDHPSNDVATKIISLTDQGLALLRHRMDIDAPRAMTGNHPMLVPPLPWQYRRRGGHLAFASHLCKSRAKNAPEADMQQLMDNSDMPLVFQALNQLQSTAWRINRFVLRTSQAIYGDATEQDCSPAILELRKNAQQKPRIAPRNLPNRPGSTEWLQKTRLDRNSSQWKSGVGDLEKRNAFWYPYQLDFRGRIYPQAGWLSPQGDDLAKGLLEFAKGKPVPPKDLEARKFLAIYGAQLAARTGISTPSLNAYAQWVEAHRTNIIASAENPLQNTWWLEYSKTGSRWQMLAFCCAWADMEEGRPVHLPVQVDGSCNGLQHMAALLRDKELAQHTNLLGTGEKNDLYLWILQGVEEDIKQLSQDASKGEQSLACWVNAHGENILSRDIAKKVVMTFSYGSNRYKDSITEFLAEQSVFAHHQFAVGAPDSTRPTGMATDAVDWFKALVAARDKDYLFPHARGIPDWDTKKIKLKTNPTSDLLLSATELQDIRCAVEQQRPVSDNLCNKIVLFLQDRLASFLTDRFQLVMEERLKNAVELQKVLQDWSMKTAQATGLAPVWISPADFPVMQHKKRKKRAGQDEKDARVVLDWTAFGLLCKSLPSSMPIFIDLKGTDGRRQIPRTQIPFFVTEPDAQKSAFPPNFIHSLDAAHLMLTLNRCQQLGIEDFVAVHDSFGTHACDVAKLARALRDSFMHMHRQPLLDQYRTWLQHLIDLASAPEASTSAQPPANCNDMHAAVLGLVRHHWLALREHAPAGDTDGLRPPPPLQPQDRFDVDAIAKSDYIFF